MIEAVVSEMSEEEQRVLEKAMIKLITFFRENY